MHLTVREAFTLQAKDEPDREFKRGDKIFDAEEIKQILAGENASHVVRTVDQMMNGSAPDRAAPQKLN
jgi:hypothetical protein